MVEALADTYSPWNRETGNLKGNKLGKPLLPVVPSFEGEEPPIDNRPTAVSAGEEPERSGSIILFFSPVNTAVQIPNNYPQN